jgi:class 3 adenylate cyclase
LKHSPEHKETEQDAGGVVRLSIALPVTAAARVAKLAKGRGLPVSEAAAELLDLSARAVLAIKRELHAPAFYAKGGAK